MLGLNRIGINDNYFDLGGDSLLATSIFQQIEKIFGKKFSLALLFSAPTIKQLADAIIEAYSPTRWSSLVPIQINGSRPPFFLVHGAGGNILIYRSLAQHLGKDQPVYGLQARGLDGKQMFHTRIEDMASHYIEEIKAVQPNGPYYIGGYCMGGTVALEMSQQFHAQGQKVALLILLETYNFSNMKIQSIFNKAYYYIQKIEFHWRNFLLLSFKQKLTFIREKMKVAKGRSKVWFEIIAVKMSHTFNRNSKNNFTLAKLWKTNDLAAINYVPKPFSASITQFAPIKVYALHRGPDLGWKRWAIGGLYIHRLPVYPAGMIVEPFVKILAEKIKACIDKAMEAI